MYSYTPFCYPTKIPIIRIQGVIRYINRYHIANHYILQFHRKSPSPCEIFPTLLQWKLAISIIANISNTLRELLMSELFNALKINIKGIASDYQEYSQKIIQK